AVLRRRRTARAYVSSSSPAQDGPEGEALLAEEHRQVLAALRRLTRRQREVLVLRYWANQTETEIAETLGLSRGAVKSTASGALDGVPFATPPGWTYRPVAEGVGCVQPATAPRPPGECVPHGVEIRVGVSVGWPGGSLDADDGWTGSPTDCTGRLTGRAAPAV